jgi:hypothetical protein
MKTNNIHKWDAVEIEWVDALHSVTDGWTDQNEIDFKELRAQSKSIITRGSFLRQDDLNVYVCLTYSKMGKQVLMGMAIPKGTILSMKKLVCQK